MKMRNGGDQGTQGNPTGGIEPKGMRPKESASENAARGHERGNRHEEKHCDFQGSAGIPREQKLEAGENHSSKRVGFRSRPRRNVRKREIGRNRGSGQPSKLRQPRKEKTQSREAMKQPPHRGRSEAMVVKASRRGLPKTKRQPETCRNAAESTRSTHMMRTSDSEEVRQQCEKVAREDSSRRTRRRYYKKTQ